MCRKSILLCAVVKFFCAAFALFKRGLIFQIATTMTNPPQPTAPSSIKPPAPSKRPFFRRIIQALELSGELVACSLSLGILGYHFIAGFNWVDSRLNASMILTGMGPVGALSSDGAKIFASAYALFSGLVFISATGILLALIFHHVLHKFHLEERDLR
jgi:hypothetical protein